MKSILSNEKLSIFVFTQNIAFMAEDKQIKLNLSSSTVDKALDGAKEFLGKLIMPAVEESGLLIKDYISSWRFKNQIRILNKSQEYCLKNGVSPKQISFKLLCPLLDYAALEDDEYLQDKWAILLTNLVDSKQNIENNIFPYILSQISKNEFLLIEKKYKERESFISKYVFLKEKEPEIQKLKDEIQTIRKNIKLQGDNLDGFDFYSEIENNPIIKKNKKIIWEYESGIRARELIIESGICIKDDDLRLFEISNLIRVGILEKVVLNEAKINSPSTYGSVIDTLDRLSSLRDLEINIDEHIEYKITELGLLFIEACLIQKK